MLVLIRNSSSLVQQSVDFVPKQLTKQMLIDWLLIICFVSLQYRVQAFFSTFHVIFIKIIHVDKITNAFIITLYYSFYASARRDSVLPNAGWAERPEGCLKSQRGRVDSL